MLKNYLYATLAFWYRRKNTLLFSLVIMAFSMVLIVCVSTYWALLNAPIAPETNKKNLSIIIPSVINKKSGEALNWFEINNEIKKTILSYDLAKDGVENKTTFTEPMKGGILHNYHEMRFTMCLTDENFFNIFHFSSMVFQ